MIEKKERNRYRDYTFKDPVRVQSRDRLYMDLVEVIRRHRYCCRKDKVYTLALIRRKIENGEGF